MSNGEQVYVALMAVACGERCPHCDKRGYRYGLECRGCGLVEGLEKEEALCSLR